MGLLELAEDAVSSTGQVLALPTWAPGLGYWIHRPTEDRYLEAEEVRQGYFTQQ